MYQLTVSFETKEELIAYLQEASTPSTVEVKTPARSRAKSTTAKQVETEMPLHSPTTNAVPEVVAPTPERIEVDRTKLVGEVKQITDELKAKYGVQDVAIQNVFGEIHVALGTTGVRVSELEDSKLVAFHKAYLEKAKSMAVAPTTVTTAFI